MVGPPGLVAVVVEPVGQDEPRRLVAGPVEGGRDEGVEGGHGNTSPLGVYRRAARPATPAGSRPSVGPGVPLPQEGGGFHHHPEVGRGFHRVGWMASTPRRARAYARASLRCLLRYVRSWHCRQPKYRPLRYRFRARRPHPRSPRASGRRATTAGRRTGTGS